MTSPGLKEAAWWPATTRMHARVHSLPWDSVTRFSLDLGKKGPVDGGRYLIPPLPFVSRSTWRCRATMLSLKLPQLLRVHQVPRVRDSPTPTSQGTGWGKVSSLFASAEVPALG